MAEKRLKEEEKKAAAEAAAKLAAEAAEREKHEAFVKAREEKRMQLANSHADQVRQRREEELQIQLQRNQLRVSPHVPCRAVLGASLAAMRDTAPPLPPLSARYRRAVLSTSACASTCMPLSFPSEYRAPRRARYASAVWR